ncbi:MAG: HPr kinase/phosphatase C-terminal domain-containing protein [Bauldia sp.]
MSPAETTQALHGSAVLVGPAGVLVCGPSGSGKSSLVLALLMGSGGSARLVADDQVVVSARDGRLFADVPPPLAGLLEIRGQGIVRLPFRAPVAVRLVVEFRPIGECPRLPNAEERLTTRAGVSLPLLTLPIGSSDGAMRVIAALTMRALDDA